jgi:hypothetical protein
VVEVVDDGAEFVAVAVAVLDEPGDALLRPVGDAEPGSRVGVRGGDVSPLDAGDLSVGWLGRVVVFDVLGGFDPGGIGLRVREHRHVRVPLRPGGVGMTSRTT